MSSYIRIYLYRHACMHIWVRAIAMYARQAAVPRMDTPEARTLCVPVWLLKYINSVDKMQIMIMTVWRFDKDFKSWYGRLLGTNELTRGHHAWYEGLLPIGCTVGKKIQQYSLYIAAKLAINFIVVFFRQVKFISCSPFFFFCLSLRKKNSHIFLYSENLLLKSFISRWNNFFWLPFANDCSLSCDGTWFAYWIFNK